MMFNKEKFKSLLHYIIHLCGMKNNVGKSVIYKLLYFSDFNFFELYEESLTGESYRKLPHGPAPIHFDIAVKELVDERKIDVTAKNIPLGGVMYNYSSLKEPNMTFNEKEFSVVDEVIEDLSNMDANQVSEYSQGDMPWRAVDDNCIIDYAFVFYRNPEYLKREYDESD